jgi:signal transduction histidine kinase
MAAARQTKIDKGLSHSPTIRLLAGLAITLSAVAVYAGYTIVQLRGLEDLQARTIDRNRTDSLLLLRIQNNLNSIALALRDMLDDTEPYGLAAWRAPFQRIRTDLEDALKQEERYSPFDRPPEQRRFLGEAVTQFWDALDRVFTLAGSGHESDARVQVRLSLEARQQAMATSVARLLVENNEIEQAAVLRTQEIYERAKRNVYLFLSAMLVLISLTSLYLVQYNRRMFHQVSELSERRHELAQQLIGTQENAFRSISRELHDDFGQILTALGVMLQRPQSREDLRELQKIVQDTLEKVRSLSHALHPMILDELGFERALQQYLPGFQKQTGIEVRYEKSGETRELGGGVATHMYRVLQEALNNVAKHAKSMRATVRLQYSADMAILEIEDEGVGFGARNGKGMGFVSMRERAEMVRGRIDFEERPGGGVLVRLTVPLEEVHA